MEKISAVGKGLSFSMKKPPSKVFKKIIVTTLVEGLSSEFDKLDKKIKKDEKRLTAFNREIATLFSKQCISLSLVNKQWRDLVKDSDVKEQVAREVKNRLSGEILMYPNEKKGKEWSDLHIAAYKRDISVIRFLLEVVGAKVNAKDKNGHSPLYFAAWQGLHSVSELLLDNGAMVNAKDLNRMFPLHFAVSNDNCSVVELLLNKGAKVNAKNRNCHSPLHLAVYHGNIPAMEVLLNRGADVNAKDKNGESALYFAINSGDSYYNHFQIKALLNGGAEVNTKDKRGYSPLHVAAYHNDCVVIQELLNRGADVNAKDMNGELPLFYAESYRVKNLLEKHDA